MEFRRIWALRGPNIWANFPVLEALLDLGELKDSASNEMPGFNERLKGWLPSMIEHRCSIGEVGGFFQRLDRGTYLAHILEHVTLEIQTLIGTPVGFGRARETDEEGVYRVAIEYEEEEIGRACLECGRELCLAAVHNRPFDVAEELARLRKRNYDIRLGPSTSAIARAAKARDIPVRRLNRDSLLQLGYGARQRRVCAAETDRTGAIAEAIAQDKELTRSLLRAVGVPVPEGRPVIDAEDAWKAAEEIGTPVVVKPQFGNHGRGVAANLFTREQVTQAHAAAREEGASIIVERFIAGADHRLLVVGQKLAAAALREPANVVGDGRSTIVQLVGEVNRDPRRSDGHATTLSLLKLDTIALAVLAEQGFTPESVPPAGVKVLIRHNANLSTGGTATDVTDMVHPDVAARAIDAAAVIGLDIAGVDILACDISRPLEEQHGALVEVNAGPGLRMHLDPSAGAPRPVGEMIISLLYPAGESARIPLVAVTGLSGKTATTRLIAHILSGKGLAVGMAVKDGLYIGPRRIDVRNGTGPVGARSLLMSPRVEAAVCETSQDGIAREGLGFDRCDVAVVTNVAEAEGHAQQSIEALEAIARVKRTIVDVVLPKGFAVLNAEDALVEAMAEYCPGKVIWFARRGEGTVVTEHRKQGGRAVFLRSGAIILADGPHEQDLGPLGLLPVESTLPAVAAAWALDISPEMIRRQLDCPPLAA